MHRLIVIGAVLAAAVPAFVQRAPRGSVAGPESSFSVLVGRPTDRSAAVSVLSDTEGRAYLEFGAAPGTYTSKMGSLPLAAGIPTEFEIVGLQPDAECFYRVSVQRPGEPEPAAGPEQKFHTARKPGGTFTFCVQGDSHPERLGRMYDSELYTRALTNIAADRPDFHFLMGDDFSIERIIESGPSQGNKTRDAVNAVYARQRSFLGIVGKSTPLMLVNGNHEQAAKYLLDGSANNFAVFAGKARVTYFPLPAPGEFYSGNATPVEHVGLLRDYYAWEWGDALFVVIDPYWHSPVAVDNEAGPDGTSTVVVPPPPGLYHYHASLKYPYLNGGMRGTVTVKDGQVDPQPRATSPRPALPPLRGAKITGFRAMGNEDGSARSWSLEYTLEGKKHFVNFRIEGQSPEPKYIFEFIDGDGEKKTQTNQARPQGDDRPPRDRPDRGGRRDGPGDRPPRDNWTPRSDAPPREQLPVGAEPGAVPHPAEGFTLTSTDVTDGRLSIDCTCDAPPPRASHAPTLAWPDPPAGTKAFAVVMHHVPPEGGAHVYMVVANLPADTRELKSGDTKLGTWGQNTVNRRNEYTPPCSKGPGDKVYTITLYALSARANFAGDGGNGRTTSTPLSRDTLLAAIKETTLATATLDVKYARAR